MSEQNKALIRSYMEGVDRGDIAVLDKYLTSNYNDHNPPPFPGLAPGLAGAKQAFNLALKAFTDFHHHIEDQVAEGDRVATWTRAYGTHTGEILGIAPTRKRVNMSGIAIHRIANGKLVEHWATIDAMGLLQQLGAAQAPPGQKPGEPLPPPPKSVAARSGQSPTENKALVRRFLEEHDRRKGPPAELCAPGYKSHMPGALTMDLQADQQMAATFYKATPDLRHVIEDMLAEGDKVAGRVTFTGTHTGELMGIPPTGKKLAVQGMAIIHVENRKIAEAWFFLDQLGMMVQMGVVQPPGSPPK